jgi:hypothetical protein
MRLLGRLHSVAKAFHQPILATWLFAGPGWDLIAVTTAKP